MDSDFFMISRKNDDGLILSHQEYQVNVADVKSP
jgi:hypothetical protein